MKKLLVLSACLQSIFVFGQIPSVEWLKRLEGSGTSSISTITLDPSGNVYMAGTFNGSVDFDPGSGSATLTSVGVDNQFFAKYDANGNYIWAKAITGGASSSRSIKIDNSGNILLAGLISGNATCDFDPSSNVLNITATNPAQDIIIAKYDPSGNLLWAHKIGNIGHDYATGMEIDSNDDVYLAGTYQVGNVDFDPGAGTQSLSSPANNFNIFILKLNSSGGFLWVKGLGTVNSDVAYAMTLDSAGNVYVTGKYQGIVDFDSGTGVYNMTSYSGGSVASSFLLKLTATGDFVWAKTVADGSNSNYMVSVKVNSSGEIYLGGYFGGTQDYDPGIGIVPLTAVGSLDVFVSKLNNNGDLIWAKQIGSSNADYVNGFELDTDEGVLLAGTYKGTCDFDPGAGTVNLISSGEDDAFVVKWDSGGNYEWVKSLSGTVSSNENLGSITLNPAGSIYISGNSNSGTINFDGIASSVSTGALLTKIGIVSCSPTTATINQNTCGDYILNGTTYTTSGTYTQTLTNVAGCDSTITLNLTINQSTTNTITTTACGSYTLNTQTYTSSGTYTQTLTNANNCDSIITINLTISDLIAPVPNTASLADITGQCSITSLTAPTATDNCAGTITGTHNATLPITTQGTTTVTWTYNDGNGNSSTQTQNVIINDNIAPVANVANLSNVTGQCSVTSLTAPTATDNCIGTITGTHNATLPITTQGTTVVTWTYNDGNGNTSTQTQNVIILDNTAPVANTANLSNVTGPCSVTSLTAPTATDNCSGIITGTHNATLPITTPGTTVVTWTYNDGNGNTSTQTQNVIVTLPISTTTLSGLTISATTSGATYQWINCGNGNTPIAGATAQSFTATANGTYAVIVTQNGCSATSACVAISTVGIDEIAQSLFTVYPNPNNGTFNVIIELPAMITITNAAGQLVTTHQMEAGENTIELKSIESGVYFISAMNPNGQISVQRVSVVQ